jgi:hypothetical protein
MGKGESGGKGEGNQVIRQSGIGVSPGGEAGQWSGSILYGEKYSFPGNERRNE